MRYGLLAECLCAAGLLSGCYGGAPERAEILVNTAPPGASCVLSQAGQPIAAVAPTPAIALVDPAAAVLAVSCRRSGFADVDLPLPPAPSGARERRVDIALTPGPPFAAPR